MPLSRRRKKKGKVVKHDAQKRAQRLEEADISAGVSLQDLINVVALQESQEHKATSHCDLEGCYGQLEECKYKLEEIEDDRQ